MGISIENRNLPLEQIQGVHNEYWFYKIQTTERVHALYGFNANYNICSLPKSSGYKVKILFLQSMISKILLLGCITQV